MKIKSRYITGVFALIILLITILYSSRVTKAIEEGVGICLNVLIPSLFIFLILSDFFQKTGALKAVLKPFGIFCGKLFKLDSSLGQALLFSLICGYPAGARLISDMVISNKITRKTATRMLYFCVNSGPAFLVGGISIPLFGSILPGLILFASQIAAFFIVGIFSSIGKTVEQIAIDSSDLPVTSALVVSVENAIKSMAIICGFTLFFSGIIGLLTEASVFNISGNGYFKSLFIGLIEVTNGTVLCKDINGMNMFLIVALITSFGGVCVQCQLKAILSSAYIKFGDFYVWRIVYCIVSLLVSWALFSQIKIPASTFASVSVSEHISTGNPVSSIILIILGVALLCCDKKTAIIKNKYKRVK